ncbi:MAG: hypothetical protein PHR16_07120 [Methylovulum sp.]|nr:hypothetical protein [Methylovulum sp.]
MDNNVVGPTIAKYIFSCLTFDNGRRSLNFYGLSATNQGYQTAILAL